MKAKIVLYDDEGNVLPDSSSTAYSFDLGSQTLNEIEQAVEQFRRQALPELEADLLYLLQKSVRQIQSLGGEAHSCTNQR